MAQLALNHAAKLEEDEVNAITADTVAAPAYSGPARLALAGMEQAAVVAAGAACVQSVSALPEGTARPASRTDEAVDCEAVPASKPADVPSSDVPISVAGSHRSWLTSVGDEAAASSQHCSRISPDRSTDSESMWEGSRAGASLSSSTVTSCSAGCSRCPSEWHTVRSASSTSTQDSRSPSSPSGANAYDHPPSPLSSSFSNTCSTSGGSPADGTLLLSSGMDEVHGGSSSAAAEQPCRTGQPVQALVQSQSAPVADDGSRRQAPRPLPGFCQQVALSPAPVQDRAGLHPQRPCSAIAPPQSVSSTVQDTASTVVVESQREQPAIGRQQSESALGDAPDTVCATSGDLCGESQLGVITQPPVLLSLQQQLERYGGCSRAGIKCMEFTQRRNASPPDLRRLERQLARSRRQCHAAAAVAASAALRNATSGTGGVTWLHGFGSGMHTSAAE